MRCEQWTTWSLSCAYLAPILREGCAKVARRLNEVSRRGEGVTGKKRNSYKCMRGVPPQHPWSSSIFDPETTARTTAKTVPAYAGTEATTTTTAGRSNILLTKRVIYPGLRSIP